ncbi:MAG TPA: exodeoxyribonuclease VII large subunit [Clostridiales bacterium]|nr:exodeoxyribonuclease VII large subunit [Clostridiales bacterium]
MHTNMIKQNITVSQLNRFLKSYIESEPRLSNIAVVGEISNFKHYIQTGHMYFSLKDEESQISAVMFNYSAATLKFKPENGMKVIATGKVSVYEKNGNYQLYVSKMEPDGTGALQIAYEQLKKKLAEEGLFDETRKRPIPRFPQKIGVITSPQGAAVKDIFNVLGRRYPQAEIVFCPALVQGDTAAPSLISALKKLNSFDDIDTIIIGRGGGSMEDLWCFNDENLVREIAASKIPVISAVGHETDFSLSDFAADLRAATPSAAAELAVPDIIELRENVISLYLRLQHLYKTYISNEELKIGNFSARVSQTGILQYISIRENDINNLMIRLDFASQRKFDECENQFSALVTRLDAISPLKTMKRGYSLATIDDKIIKSTKGIKIGDVINLSLSKGKLDCEVIKID